VSPEALLREARRLVHDGDRMKDGAWARAAAFLARQALEQAIRQRLIRSYKLSGYPSFKALLLASEVFLGRDLARRAGWSWEALSRATHHHGYELAPTAGELQAWMGTVEEVVGRAERGWG